VQIGQIATPEQSFSFLFLFLFLSQREAHATPSHGWHTELWYQNLSCWIEVARASRPWV
jgi:hypothetical protein